MKPLPNNIEAERSVLGAALKDAKCLPGLLLLHPEHFYTPKHSILWSVIIHLYNSSEAVDLALVAAELMRRKSPVEKHANALEAIGGRAYMVDLIESVATTTKADAFAVMLIEAFSKRELIRAARDVLGQVDDDTISAIDIASQLGDRLLTATVDRREHKFERVGDLMVGVMSDLGKVETKEIKFGIPTGYSNLDKIMTCRKGELIIVGGRPSMGKTTFINCVASQQAALGYKVAVFSAETRSQEYALRTLMAESQVSGQRASRGELNEAEWDRLNKGVASIYRWSYWLDDTPGINIGSLVAKAQQLKQTEGLDILFVDYIQKLSTSENLDRRTEIDMYASKLKLLAQQLSIPVVVSSQLNRSCETRGRTWQDKRPQLSDLKETGGMEQDADIVLFLFRPDKYMKPSAKERPKYADIVEVWIKKQRNGATSDSPIDFYLEGPQTRLVEMGTLA